MFDKSCLSDRLARQYFIALIYYINERELELKMLETYQRDTNIGVGIGIIANIISRFNAESHPVLSIIFGCIGAVAMIWGCAMYAKGKGYSGWWGLLGIFWIIGFIILFFFRDKYKQK